MWRVRPLAKIVLRMLFFGLILGLALGMLTIVAFRSSIPAPPPYYYQRIMLGEVVNGAILGLLIGLAMASYAGIVHRSIHKPPHFRFAMLIVATIASLAVVQRPFHIVSLGEFGIPLVDWVIWALRDADPVLIALFFATIAKHIAIGLISLHVASRYLSEASAQFMKSTGQQLE